MGDDEMREPTPEELAHIREVLLGDPEPGGRTPCCARCRRGTRAHGHTECGYKLACPKACHG